ncbi:DUF2867 domain-containing protein [Williamsia serinedens]|uniref:Uncharacterized conserved protein YbjT, contains NAD(P)-binding and DUF2867 domains n=1 Tax=Williamsia serinedens TaxID=391736 RepID=A0ABT1H0J3_9NOCA|nr:DUF2867 domain-containing protein [Williamsia serinedens]MCP2160053.1 Uncharacterized conserved protein YbjT, contains NAD(P)-binding and DUF2867 domains [Williamsia serinedens]
MSTTGTALVTGATGYIGGRLAPRLAAAGWTVRALARTPAKLDDAPWVGEGTVVQGDLSDRDSLMRAFDGVDVVYHLVHSMGGDGTGDFKEEEAESARNVAAAAKACGVSRIVYLGGLHPDGTKLSKHLASRVEVGEILLASGIETVVLQAGVVIGSGSASFELIRHLTERLPVMTTPRWVHNTIQPIAVRDALHYLVEAASATVPESRAWDIGGTEVFEYGEMMQLYAQAAGLPKRRMIVLPYLTPTLASRWVGTVTPIPTSLARPLVESLECDAVMKNHDIDEVIPRPDGGLLTYRQALDAALDRVRRADTSVPWSNADASVSPAEPLPSDPAWAGEDVMVEERTATTRITPKQLWDTVSSIGGDTGWFTLDAVWRARTAVDLVVGGGPGPKKRRPTGEPTKGEPLDWWRVEDVEPGRLLRLRAETTMPGTAWLELGVEPDGSGARLRQRTIYYPKGLAGLGYWYGQLPAHKVIFATLVRDIIRNAEKSARSSTRA